MGFDGGRTARGTRGSPPAKVRRKSGVLKEGGLPGDSWQFPSQGKERKWCFEGGRTARGTPGSPPAKVRRGSGVLGEGGLPGGLVAVPQAR